MKKKHKRHLSLLAAVFLQILVLFICNTAFNFIIRKELNVNMGKCVCIWPGSGADRTYTDRTFSDEFWSPKTSPIVLAMNNCHYRAGPRYRASLRIWSVPNPDPLYICIVFWSLYVPFL